jgi:hypothetical protein
MGGSPPRTSSAAPASASTLRGENHHEAVTLLAKADGEAARHLRVLLGLKTKTGYGQTLVSADDAKRAGRAAEALLEQARTASADMAPSET